MEHMNWAVAKTSVQNTGATCLQFHANKTAKQAKRRSIQLELKSKHLHSLAMHSFYMQG